MKVLRYPDYSNKIKYKLGKLIPNLMQVGTERTYPDYLLK